MKNWMIALLSAAGLLVGCGEPAAHVPIWKQNSDTLVKKLKPDYEIVRCEWAAEVINPVKERIPSVPSPSDTYLCGIIYISEEDTAKLMSGYDWTAFPDAELAKLPDGCAAHSEWFYQECRDHIFQQNNIPPGVKWLHSKSYSAKSSQNSAFCAGRMLFAPDIHAIYFFLHTI